MPNSANRKAGNNKAGTGHKEEVAKTPQQKPNPQRSDKQHGSHERNHRGDTGRSSSGGRKEASGGGPEE